MIPPEPGRYRAQGRMVHAGIVLFACVMLAGLCVAQGVGMLDRRVLVMGCVCAVIPSAMAPVLIRWRRQLHVQAIHRSLREHDDPRP